jgi:hypothetical protein
LRKYSILISSCTAMLALGMPMPCEANRTPAQYRVVNRSSLGSPMTAAPLFMALQVDAKRSMRSPEPARITALTSKSFSTGSSLATPKW